MTYPCPKLAGGQFGQTILDELEVVLVVLVVVFVVVEVPGSACNVLDNDVKLAL